MNGAPSSVAWYGVDYAPAATVSATCLPTM